jgi:site-specific DNA-methyltransferase (adenine-specific)
MALREIREARLYRERYATFEDYCRERWGMSRVHAHRQIEAANIAQLLPIGNRPATESQARELAPLVRQDEQEALDVYRELREEHGDKLTARIIREAVRPRLARDRRREEAQAKEEERRRRVREEAARLGEVEGWYHGRWEDYIPTLPDGSVKLLLTDPPYGMAYRSNRRTVRHDHIENDDEQGAVENLLDMLAAVYPKLADDAHVYLFASPRLEAVFEGVIEEASYEVKSRCVWAKNNTSMGDLTGAHAPKHERILHAVKGRPRLSPRLPDVLEAPRVRSMRHPTEKPVPLLAKLIEATTVEGDVVLDPYGGVASTLVAAKFTGRVGLGCEINALYHAAGAVRLNNLDGGRAAYDRQHAESLLRWTRQARDDRARWIREYLLAAA